MKREQFLKELRDALYLMQPAERDDVIRDQDEYIRDAVAAGRGEEQVVSSLGSPRSFAQSITAESKLQKAEDAPTLNQQMSGTFGAVLAILALAPLNLIFVLGPFMALVGCTIAGWVTALTILCVAIIGLAIWVLKLAFLSVGLVTNAASLFFILGWVGGGIIGIYVMFYITKYFTKGTLAYLRWNLNFISGRAKV